MSLTDALSIVMTPGVPDCYMVNVVSTFRVGVALNGSKVALTMRDTMPVKFNKDRFAAYTIKFNAIGMREVTCHMFGTGSCVETGPPNDERAREAGHMIVRHLNVTQGIYCSMNDFCIRNIVSSMSLGFMVDLETMKEILGTRVHKDQKFPAAILVSAINPKMKILVYESGGVVITGCKKRDDVRRNQISIYFIALNFIKKGKASGKKGKALRTARSHAALPEPERKMDLRYLEYFEDLRQQETQVKKFVGKLELLQDELAVEGGGVQPGFQDIARHFNRFTERSCMAQAQAGAVADSTGLRFSSIQNPQINLFAESNMPQFSVVWDDGKKEETEPEEDNQLVRYTGKRKMDEKRKKVPTGYREKNIKQIKNE